MATAPAKTRSASAPAIDLTQLLQLVAKMPNSTPVSGPQAPVLAQEQAPAQPQAQAAPVSQAAPTTPTPAPADTSNPSTGQRIGSAIKNLAKTAAIGGGVAAGVMSGGTLMPILGGLLGIHALGSAGAERRKKIAQGQAAYAKAATQFAMENPELAVAAATDPRVAAMLDQAGVLPKPKVPDPTPIDLLGMLLSGGTGGTDKAGNLVGGGGGGLFGPVPGTEQGAAGLPMIGQPNTLPTGQSLSQELPDGSKLTTTGRALSAFDLEREAALAGSKTHGQRQAQAATPLTASEKFQAAIAAGDQAGASQALSSMRAESEAKSPPSGIESSIIEKMKAEGASKEELFQAAERLAKAKRSNTTVNVQNLPANALQEIRELGAGRDALTEIDRLFKKMPEAVGVFRGKIPNSAIGAWHAITGDTEAGMDELKLRAVTEDFLVKYTNKASGAAFTEEEVARYKAINPSVDSHPLVFMANLAIARHNYDVAIAREARLVEAIQSGRMVDVVGVIQGGDNSMFADVPAVLGADNLRAVSAADYQAMLGSGMSPQQILDQGMTVDPNARATGSQ